MHSQVVFYAAIGISAFFALIFLFRGTPRDRALLKMQSDRQSEKTSKELASVSGANRARPQAVSNETVDSMNQSGRVKSLNVIFNYNGHSWDAYEVLGVPAGAPLSMAQEAFDKALRSTDPVSHEFLKAAFAAIQENLRRS